MEKQFSSDINVEETELLVDNSGILYSNKTWISIDEVKNKVVSLITCNKNWAISKECYSTIIKELDKEDFIKFYLENINHIKNYSQVSNIVKFNDMELLYSLIDKMLLIEDISKANLIFQRIEKLEVDTSIVDSYRKILYEKYKSWNNISLQNYFWVNKLEELFISWEYEQAIKIFNSIEKKSAEFQNIFFIYSNKEDFLEFVDSRDNFFAHINWVKNIYNLNLLLNKFLEIWNYFYAEKISKIIEKKWWLISKTNNSNLLKWKEYSENIWKNVFEKMLKNKWENRKKFLSVQSKVEWFDDLIHIFSEEYTLIRYNTGWKKLIFLNVLSRFLTELNFPKKQSEEIEMILNVYRKTWILKVVDNVPFSQKNIDDLAKLESKDNDYYLTITDLQIEFQSLYDIFRRYIVWNDNDNKWKKFVESLKKFLDLYWEDYFANRDKLKIYLNQLLYRTFKDRFSKYKKEINLLWWDKKDFEWKYKYLNKYSTFKYIDRELELSRRTKTLYFLIDNDYKVWIEYFANMNKSNLAIFMFLNLARQDDIVEHEEKIINYYKTRFTNRFQSEKSRKVWVDQSYEDWYENLSISYVYEMLFNSKISHNLLTSFENILKCNDIDIKNIKSSKWDIIKNWTDNILKRFDSWDFWDIDYLLD